MSIHKLSITYILSWGVLISLNSCSFFSNNNNSAQSPEDKLLAEVKGSKLFNSDLEGLVPQGTSSSDSTQLIERYINSWVKKQLLLLRAKSEVDLDDAGIERKLLDYKYDLIAYEFEKEYVQQELDTSIKQNDLNDYYQNNQENFILKEPIIKGILVVLPYNLPEKNEISPLIRNNNPDDLQKLKEYCVKFAETYHLNDVNWVELDNLIQNTPFEQSLLNNLLIPNNFTEFSDQDFVYYLKTIDAKNTGDIAPLEYVEQTIKNLILNQRKVKLAKDLQQNIYEEAKKNNLFIIHQ